MPLFSFFGTRENYLHYGATLARSVYRYRCSDLGCSMIHDLQSHARFFGHLQRNANAVVRNLEDRPLAGMTKADRYPFGFSMFARVVDRFLGDAKEVGGCLAVFQYDWFRTQEGAVDVKEVADRASKLRKGVHKTFAFWPNRMQPMRKISRFVDCGAE